MREIDRLEKEGFKNRNVPSFEIIRNEDEQEGEWWEWQPGFLPELVPEWLWSLLRKWV